MIERCLDNKLFGVHFNSMGSKLRLILKYHGMRFILDLSRRYLERFYIAKPGFIYFPTDDC